ncbi:hypothetical protein HHI36_016271 [Cryptolaemus montrouzieri]|uniref:Non-structural maintenance of chromosomes element 4 n=1 Tax=Cryptolaemus montrouzieri TaxID=559131 RepID=A0ABD2NJB2_9CUCU
MVLSSSSSILVKCINAVDIATANYEPTEFCESLSNLLKGDDEEYCPTHLLKLLNESRVVIPEISPYENVYGSYELNKIQPVPKKPVKTVIKEKFTKKVLEKVATVDKSEEGIDEIVKGLYAVLMEEYTKNNEQPINYYDYVINTEDFTSTIENMFYCSFLIRDGKARIDLDGDKPTIEPITKKEMKKFREEGGVNSQIITTITMDDWETYKRKDFCRSI